MELSRTFRVAFLITVYLSVLAIAAHINGEERISFKKFDTQFDIINRLAEKAAANVKNLQDKKQVIKDHIKDFGEKIMKSINYEIKNAAITGILKANFSRSPSDTYKCIQNSEKEALKDVAKYYSEKFLKPIGFYASEDAEDEENDSEIYEEDMQKSDITDVSSNTSNDDVNYLKNLIELTVDLMDYTNDRTDEHWTAVEKCFPRRSLKIP